MQHADAQQEAKLLWAQGQQSMAMRVAWALLGSPGSAAPMDQLTRSRLQSLLGKWLSLNRYAADLLLYRYSLVCMRFVFNSAQGLRIYKGDEQAEMHNMDLSPCSSESSSTILDLMTEALENAEDSTKGRSTSNEVTCRAAFRLATYADSLYRAVQEQISSPKWATAVAIIQDKKRQVGPPALML